VLGGLDAVNEDRQQVELAEIGLISSWSLRVVPDTKRREIEERVIALPSTPTGSRPAR
jgi:hypothetical protein